MKRLPFIPQLDSFRFFAVLLVIVSHWVPNNKINILPNGYLGVTFFFVLSGYLISSNLFYLKQGIDKKEISVAKAFGIFYSRRTLRIFPLYFLVIFLLYFLDKSIFSGKFIWYATYTPNFLMFKEKHWPGMLSHFWSLGVEEQFYLIWPLLLFTIQRKWLKYLLPGIVVLSIAFKIAVFQESAPFFTFYDVLPISCFDAFGIGAFLAYLSFSENSSLKAIFERIPFSYGLILSIAGMLLVYRVGISFLFGFFVSISSFFIIRKTFTGFKGFSGRILNNRAIRYLGKISYGLYVYHNLMPWLWRCLTCRETDHPLPIGCLNSEMLSRPSVSLLAQFVLLIVISSISWYAVEKPLNDLKVYFR